MLLPASLHAYFSSCHLHSHPRSACVNRFSFAKCFSSGSETGLMAYDSLSSTYRALPHCTADLKGIAWYVCGPTVYDSAHLGHGRTYVLLDILRRVTLHLHNAKSGAPRPLYVMNITDVDDKIIKRSTDNAQQSTKEADPTVLARYFEHEFWQDMDRLNVLRPDVICRVSEHVTSTIVPYIQQIVDGGLAYVITEEEETKNGSVYFDVRAFEEKSNGLTKYGKLAPDVASSDFFTWDDSNNNEGDQSQVAKKRDPRDFALWKYRPRQSNSALIEPECVSFPSPWGPGRPGWHVECSAMIERLSNDFSSTHKFFVHAGGIDLKFPHHSNEIAQAEAFGIASGTRYRKNDWKEWIPHWMHTGHLYVKGRKMSKSLKNFVTIREMLNISSKEHTNEESNEWYSPADDFRLWCIGLSGSYRGSATYSTDRMDEARVIREKWVRFLIEGERVLESKLDRQNQSTRYWHSIDYELFQAATKSSINCRNALVGSASSSNSNVSFDLDGSKFVKEITMVAEQGMKYLDDSKGTKNSRPAEPLKFTLSTIRELLSLVGFTALTYNAGLLTSKNHEVVDVNSAKYTSFINEIVAFRSLVRSSAISGIRNEAGTSSLKEILRLCDELRDEIMPSLGVEISDRKSNENNEDEGGNWRSCSPKQRSTDTR